MKKKDKKGICDPDIERLPFHVSVNGEIVVVIQHKRRDKFLLYGLIGACRSYKDLQSKIDRIGLRTAASMLDDSQNAVKAEADSGNVLEGNRCMRMIKRYREYKALSPSKGREDMLLKLEECGSSYGIDLTTIE